MTAATMTGAIAPQAGETKARAGGPALASAQVLARWTGVLFIITFVASIPAVFTFYAPALGDPAFALGGGRDSGIAWGAFLEMIVILANIGTAVALFPIVKRQNEALALGFVTARLVESGFIAVGLLSMLALGTLRLEAAGADADTLVVTGQALVAIHDWTFLLGPGTVVGIGNGLILGYLMFTSGLVPRGMAALGLVGGPMLLAANVGILFGLHEAGSVWQIIATVPEFIWELSLGIWLTVKGFRPAAVAALGFDAAR
jgi:hypothetical protein